MPSDAARKHLEDAILPGAALYLAMRDRLGRERAYELIAACLAAIAEDRRRVLLLLDRTPWLYPVLRWSGKRILRLAFSPPAFEVRLLEDSAQRLRFDMARCYYLDTLTRLGIPELAPLYCHCDGLLYGDLKHVRFVRMGTLAQGSDRCDFCFERSAAARAAGAVGTTSGTAAADAVGTTSGTAAADAGSRARRRRGPAG